MSTIGDIDFGLPDADRFDEHDVEAKGVEEVNRTSDREREAAELTACRHAANEDTLVRIVIHHANAVAERRAPR